MKILIAEDDFISRKVMMLCLSEYGNCDVAADGNEAISAVRLAFENKDKYDLICLDIMMPNIDGQEALKTIREIEQENGLPIGKGAKILMVTALSDNSNIMSAFRGECDAYIVKPVNKDIIKEKLTELELIN